MFVRVLSVIIGLIAVSGMPVLCGGDWQVQAASGTNVYIKAGSRKVRRSISLGVNKSIVVDVSRDVQDILVSNPAIVDAVVRTARRIYIIGKKAGTTNVFLFDKAGKQIAVIDVVAGADAGPIEALIRKHITDSTVQAETTASGIILSGTVASSADLQRAFDIARQFVDKDAIANMITVRGREQVMVKVTIAEMQRSVIKQLGININQLGRRFSPDKSILAQISNPFSVNNATSGLAATLTLGDQFQGTFRAMERDGIVRTLAEPTLSAISGESAKFLVGGEFPVPVGRDRDGNVTIEFKPFGVGLSFTPVVLSESKISLKINTEVSEITTTGSFSISDGTNADVTIPALRVRRADTTVELPSGGSIAIAGLVDQRLRQTIDGVPGLKELPVLGTLFRSRDFLSEQTEMVVIVTPYIVKPVQRDKLIRPDKNFQVSSDAAAIFLQRLNQIYSVNGGAPRGPYHGRYGFIVE